MNIHVIIWMEYKILFIILFEWFWFRFSTHDKNNNSKFQFWSLPILGRSIYFNIYI